MRLGRMAAAVAAICVASLAFVSCGGGKKASNGTTGTTVAHSSTRGTSSTIKLPEDPRASRAVAVLERNGLPIRGVIVYSADTDPNHLLGQPGGYTSKVAWTDSRINPSGGGVTSTGSVELGGSIEVYASHSGAQQRAKYIANIAAKTPILKEYDFVAGDIVLRLSSALTPNEVHQYAASLGASAVTG